MAPSMMRVRFEPNAITISAAILVSGFISLTLTPMLCSRFLKPIDHGKKHNAVYNFMERVFKGGLGFYERTLRFSLHHRFAVLLLHRVVQVHHCLDLPRHFLAHRRQQALLEPSAIAGRARQHQS